MKRVLVLLVAATAVAVPGGVARGQTSTTSSTSTTTSTTSTTSTIPCVPIPVPITSNVPGLPPLTCLPDFSKAPAVPPCGPDGKPPPGVEACATVISHEAGPATPTPATLRLTG